MKRHTIPLGRIFGIPIGLDYSWFLIFALITWTLAVGYFPQEFKTWAPAVYWIIGAVTAILLFASVLLHELGHSLVALRYKVPVRSITLFIFGGVAQIGAQPPSAVAEFWIAVAGPAVSLTLAGLFTVLEPVFADISPLYGLVKYLAYINAALALFNLIPGFPLDGGRVFRAILWGITDSLRRATMIAATVGRVVAFLFIFVGVLQMFSGNFAGGLWIAFIGWFLESAAVAQVQQQVIHDLLEGHKVAEAMSRDYAVIPADTTLQELVDHHVLSIGRRSFVVNRGEQVAGLLTLHHIKKVPRPEWSATTAAEVMTPVDQMKWIRPDAGLSEALEEMDRDGVNQLPVMENGKLLGVLRRDDVISYLRMLRELGV
jgi:Zn-dependent protease